MGEGIGILIRNTMPLCYVAAEDGCDCTHRLLKLIITFLTNETQDNKWTDRYD